MTEETLSPTQKLAAEINSLRSTVNSLQDDIRLASQRDAVAGIDNQTGSIPQKISDLRTRGYAFGKGQETRAADLKQRWAAQRDSVLHLIDQEAQNLNVQMQNVESLMMQLSGRADSPAALAQPWLSQAKAAVNTLQSKSSAASSTISGMYNDISSEYSKIGAELDKVDWMLTQLAQATFPLLATEAGIHAVDAVWAKTGEETKTDPRGVFYLTDQRLIFEQKQEIATKKFLFVTTATEKVQKLLFKVPVVLLDSVKPTHEGFFKNEDHLHMTFSSGAPFPTLHFHLLGQDCVEWQGLLGRAKAKDFENERAVAVDQAAVEKTHNAPTQCPVCGAAITKPVLRGMDSITCDYCGNVIRL